MFKTIRNWFIDRFSDLVPTREEYQDYYVPYVPDVPYHEKNINDKTLLPEGLYIYDAKLNKIMADLEKLKNELTKYDN